MEVTGSAWFYTDNDDFFNGNRLENDPLVNVRYMGTRSQESVGRDTDNMVVSFSVFGNGALSPTQLGQMRASRPARVRPTSCAWIVMILSKQADGRRQWDNVPRRQRNRPPR